MHRVLAIVAFGVLCASQVAEAGKLKVSIETEPAGATVYFESTENTPVCQATPCVVDMPAQETAVYIQLKNYQPELEDLDPAKKQLHIKKILKPAVGAIVIKDGKGARVTIDDEDKGKAPDRFEVGEGAHHVIVTDAKDKHLYEDFVEVKVGEDTTIEVGDGTSGGGDKVDPDGPAITKPSSPRKPHDRYVLGSVSADVGFRSFSYTNNQTMGTLRDVSESGEFLLGPMVEAWPMEILGIGQAKGLSVMARVQFHLNSQAVDSKDTQSLSTFWRNIEAQVRYRWTFADVVGVEVVGGYGHDTYRFSGQEAEIGLVPDADYQSVRFGARIVGALGKVEPYLYVENRIVLTGGSLDSRFTGGSSATGLHGALGAQARFGPLGIRLEAALTHYSWTFKSNSTSDMRIADGATDAITQISASVGYSY